MPGVVGMKRTIATPLLLGALFLAPIAGAQSTSTGEGPAREQERTALYRQGVALADQGQGKPPPKNSDRSWRYDPLREPFLLWGLLKRSPLVSRLHGRSLR